MKRITLLLTALMAFSGVPDAQAGGLFSDLLSKIKPAKHGELEKGNASTEAKAGQTDQRQAKPDMYVQLGHSKAVGAIAISPSGKYALSGSDDRTLKLWDIATGTMIRTYVGHSKPVSSVAFSPDGKYLLSGSIDKTLKLWDIVTGHVIRTFEGHSSYVKSVAFSPDGKSILSGGGGFTYDRTHPYDRELKLWNVATGRARSFRGFSFPVHSIAFSPDGKYALSEGNGFKDGKFVLEVKLWNIAMGRAVRSFEGEVTSFAFSPDSRYVLLGDINGKLMLWEVATKQTIRTFKGGAGEVYSVAFSRDGRHLLSVTGVEHKEDKGVMTLWDVATGREIHSFTFKKRPKLVALGALTPDEKYVLGVKDNILKLWDVATGREVRTFNPYSTKVHFVAFSPDGKRVLSNSSIGDVLFWDIATGRMVRFHKGGATPGGRYVVAIEKMGETLPLLDVSTGQAAGAIARHLWPALSVSSDGRFALSRRGGVLILWKTSTGEEVRRFKGQNGSIHSAAFSPDSRYALSGMDGIMVLWDIAAGRMIRTFQVGKSPYLWPINAVAFSPDGRYVLSGSEQFDFSMFGESRYIGDIRLWDIATGRKVRAFKGQSGYVKSIAFSPDGKSVLSLSDEDSPKLWNTATGREIHSLSGHTDAVTSGAFSPDGRYVVSGSDDMSTRIWDAATGKELVKMLAFKGGEWISITPEGFFSASSPRAAAYLKIRKGLKVYGINQFYDVFYRPDIVKAALAGKDTSSMVTLSIAEAIKNPPPLVEKLEAPASSKSEKVKVAYTIKSEGGGIGEVRVFHNGKLVKSDGFIRAAPKELFAKSAKEQTGAALEGEMRSIAIKAKDDVSFKRVTETETKPDVYEDSVEIEPIPGENEVSIIAFNAQNSVQSLTKTITFKSDLPPVKPRLHILAIGIDRYRDKSVDLKYAVKDSHDLASRLKAEAASIYGAKNIFVTTIADGQATRKGIMSAIDRLAAEVKPTDHFVLFVASHGVLLGDQYYMVTNDYNGTLDATQLISSNEFVNLSKRIRALSQLYIIDTCHAGGMDGVVSGLYDARMSVLAKKMGLHVFASANSVEEALDGYKGNGLFTHTLLDALNNNPKADANSDKQVSLIELGSYSKAETKQIAAGLGHAQEPLIINFGQDDPVYRIH